MQVVRMRSHATNEFKWHYYGQCHVMCRVIDDMALEWREGRASRDLYMQDDILPNAKYTTCGMKTLARASGVGLGLGLGLGGVHPVPDM